MRIKKLMISLVIVSVLVVALLAMSGCSNEISFKSIAGFKREQVARVEIISEYCAGKDASARIDDIYKVLDSMAFHDANEGKITSDMQINVRFRVNFYLDGVDGYYSMVFNNGFQGMDGYNYKKSKTGFYVVNNIDEVLMQLNQIFHAL